MQWNFIQLSQVANMWKVTITHSSFCSNDTSIVPPVQYQALSQSPLLMLQIIHGSLQKGKKLKGTLFHTNFQLQEKD